MEATHSSKMSVLTRPILHHIPEDGILHDHHCKDLRSYKEGRNIKCGCGHILKLISPKKYK
jgi:hypothetical protein